MGKILKFVSRLLGNNPTLLDRPREGEDPDAAVLDHLRAHGADLSKPTHVLFYLYCPTEDGAKRMAERGADAALTAEIHPSASDDGTWLCLLQGTLVPSETALRHYREKFDALAAAEGGDYDGWEAAVTK